MCVHVCTDTHTCTVHSKCIQVYVQVSLPGFLCSLSYQQTYLMFPFHSADVDIVLVWPPCEFLWKEQTTGESHILHSPEILASKVQPVYWEKNTHQVSKDWIRLLSSWEGSDPKKGWGEKGSSSVTVFSHMGSFLGLSFYLSRMFYVFT